MHKALVLGLGFRTGVAVSNFLTGRGVFVVASDRKDESELSDVLHRLDPAVRVVTGEQKITLLDEGFDAVILSPGVPAGIPLVEEARRRRIPVFGEIELAFRHLKGTIVGITGTDGKSTVTAMTGHVLKELGYDTKVGGNIGIPLVTFAGSTTSRSVIVAELSSFQLETISSFRPDVAVLLNVTPDHMDRHDGMEGYFEAKMRIALNQHDDDCFIYNLDDEWAARGAARIKARKQSFSMVRDDADIFYSGGGVREKGTGVEIFRAEDLKVLGLHNVQNAMAAVLAVCSLVRKRGGTPDYGRIAGALASFPGLPHRLERIGRFQGRDFINDSKATTVNAVLTALKSLPGSGVIILGGRTKGDEYARLAEGLNGRIRALVLIGESRSRFAKLFTGYRQVLADTMDDAVAKAMRESRKGDTILLSPACASFDMFTDYEERGERFRESFRRLESGALQWT